MDILWIQLRERLRQTAGTNVEVILPNSVAAVTGCLHTKIHFTKQSPRHPSQPKLQKELPQQNQVH